MEHGGPIGPRNTKGKDSGTPEDALDAAEETKRLNLAIQTEFARLLADLFKDSIGENVALWDFEDCVLEVLAEDGYCRDFAKCRDKIIMHDGRLFLPVSGVYADAIGEQLLDEMLSIMGYQSLGDFLMRTQFPRDLKAKVKEKMTGVEFYPHSDDDIELRASITERVHRQAEQAAVEKRDV